METKYSRKEFEGYTHRFIVQFKIDNDFRNDTNMHIYSNSGDKDELVAFINNKKTDKVISFQVVHKATKEQDEMTAKFIDETLNNF